MPTAPNLKLILEILDRVVPFVERAANANYVRNQLEEMDVAGTRDELRGYLILLERQEKEIKAKVVEGAFFSNSTSIAGVKEYYHTENRHGQRCFDDRVHSERERGEQHPDQGSPAFAANRHGICNGCGERIVPGDMIIIRQNKKDQPA